MSFIMFSVKSNATHNAPNLKRNYTMWSYFCLAKIIKGLEAEDNINMCSHVNVIAVSTVCTVESCYFYCFTVIVCTVVNWENNVVGDWVMCTL